MSSSRDLAMLLQIALAIPYNEYLPKNKKFFFIVILGFLDALTPFSIDLYLPSFGYIAHDLNSTAERLALTVSVYFIGFAIGQLLYGPLLDRYGRKRPLYLGLSIFLLGTAGCMMATSVEMLLFFRFIAAMGGSAASVGAMTMVRDLFPPEDVAKVLSLMILVLSASPLLAPTIGALIVGHMGWRHLFALLLGFGILDLALVAFALPHVYDPDPTVKLTLTPIIKNFGEVLRQPQFSTYTFAGSLAFAGLFVFVAGAPAIFIDFFGVSPQTFGAIFALLAGGMIAGTQLNHFLAKKFNSAQIFRGSLSLELLFGTCFLIAALLGVVHLPQALGFLFVILLSAGLGFPNAAAMATAPFTRNLGSASALLGFFQLGIGSITATLIGLLQVKGPLPMALAMAGSAAFAYVVLMRGQKIALEPDTLTPQ